ncbi:MAG: hypothetical protein KIT31_16940, partial [Deltaproteobacteria bacterium]|nr:hypothetical protein [Deltaproteobacteria bacterium]
EPDPPDPSKLIAELGAVPAWQAVVDRAQLLGRREQHGVVYGRIGPAILVPAPAPVPAGSGAPPDAGAAAPAMVPSPYVWLVDDTEGSGALGIRVALGGRSAPEGARVALGGAWYLDDERRWYWKVDVVQALPPGPPPAKDEVIAPVPTHAIPNGELPWGTKGITFAKDGDNAYFTLVGRAPANDGDGWPVANELGDVVYGLLTLPGERPSFGGQDLRSPDERWQLRAGQVYWIKFGRVRKRDGKPAMITARTSPIRVK